MIIEPKDYYTDQNKEKGHDWMIEYNLIKRITTRINRSWLSWWCKKITLTYQSGVTKKILKYYLKINREQEDIRSIVRTTRRITTVFKSFDNRWTVLHERYRSTFQISYLLLLNKIHIKTWESNIIWSFYRTRGFYNISYLFKGIKGCLPNIHWE